MILLIYYKNEGGIIMPIPLLFLAAAATTAFGAVGHSVAKETNEEAQKIAEKAQKQYEYEKGSLGLAQSGAERELNNLGMQKKYVMDTSIQRFLNTYNKIKHIELSKSFGLNEISRYALSAAGVKELQSASMAYRSIFAERAAAGAIAFALGGSLVSYTGAAVASMALGPGLTGGLAGASALLTRISLSPLAALTGPLTVVTALSASFKADENLEKAKAMRAEAEAEIEKMKVTETLLKGIEQKARMFDGLLTELNEIFSSCLNVLEKTVKKRLDYTQQRVDVRSLTAQESELIAVTRSLAGAVKAVIDVPILNENGNLSRDADQIYHDINACLPDFYLESMSLY